MFHAYSGIFTKLHIARHICAHWDSDIFRILALPVQSNVKQQLLFKSGSFHFCKSKHFFLQDSNSIITITIIIACNPRYHTTHPTHASTPPTQARHPRHPSKHAIHTGTNSMPFLKLLFR